MRDVASSTLTPLRFLQRSEDVWADRPAVRDADRLWTYAAHGERVRRAAGALAGELGWEVGTREDALGCDIVTCVTPGHEPVVTSTDLRPGVHLNMLGADGPGKAEMEVDAVPRCNLFCDEWTQASHGGELTGAVVQGLITRDAVTDVGAVITGQAAGRRSDGEITLFDSTGLAIQDLALCHAVLGTGAAAGVQTVRI